MTNASLKLRLRNAASAVTRALQRSDEDAAVKMRALSAQIDLSLKSLDRLTESQRQEGRSLGNRLSVEASIYEDGFQTQALGDIRALEQWLEGIAE